jgi:hypothetical protein
MYREIKRGRRFQRVTDGSVELTPSPEPVTAPVTTISPILESILKDATAPMSAADIMLEAARRGRPMSPQAESDSYGPPRIDNGRHSVVADLIKYSSLPDPGDFSGPVFDAIESVLYKMRTETWILDGGNRQYCDDRRRGRRG